MYLVVAYLNYVGGILEFQTFYEQEVKNHEKYKNHEKIFSKTEGLTSKKKKLFYNL
jgi:hypothetical protein